jgi:alanine or glycine:cation symporter, AGCS family
LYLKEVPGGAVLSMLYGLGCLFFGLIVGNAMQTHSISLSIATTWGAEAYLIAVCITAFICYVLFGGAQRIIAVSDRIVPVKIVVFFGAAFILIGYHSGALFSALQLMLQGAFRPQAMIGGLVGFTFMQAIQAGMNLSVTATESGLGTAAILFGYTGATDAFKSGLMGMISTFVSSLVCFLVSLCIVISGVWDSGLQSSQLTISAFNTVFGQWGGWLVSFLTISFGAGVLVSFAYITRAAWLSVTRGRYEHIFVFLYCAAAFIGAVVDTGLMWGAVALINGTLLTINLTGLLLLMPRLSKYVRESEKRV